MPAKRITLSAIKTPTHPYKNIKTVVSINSMSINSIEPCIMYGSRAHNRIGRKVLTWSNEPCVHYGQPKIILGHKMYGMPFFDRTGEYGVSNRDNYVIIDYSLEDLERINTFLSQTFIINVYDATRYRMRYLEKYAFQFIPDITVLKDFPLKPTNASLHKYFKTGW